MTRPKTGQKIVIQFYDHLFEDDWTDHGDLRNRTWEDLDDPAVQHPLPVVEQVGYVLEWSTKRIILRTTRSSDNDDMAWYIVPQAIIGWKLA